VGAEPGYGYRRLMISASGKRKQIMQSGEYKSLTTDRVILVPGPRREVLTVRLMFDMASEGCGPTEIARELNRRHISYHGKLWEPQNIWDILTNLKYAGWNVWNRGSEHLQKTRTANPQTDWIMVPNAFAPIVDQETFDRANANRPKKADQSWSDNEILRRIRRLLRTKGRLSETLLRKARGMPSTGTIHRHFGKYSDLYKLIGFSLAPQYVWNAQQLERSKQLRSITVNTLRELFPANIKATRLPKKRRSLLLIDDTFLVSVLLCRSKRKRGELYLVVEPNPAERSFVTLICTMNDHHDQVLDYFLLPDMDWFRNRRFLDDSYLRRAVHLDKLTDFYSKVLEVWAKKARSTEENTKPRPVQFV
jgi:Recombinase